jgi:L,D-peptidoglycan transpeptidase YkuD (ErfK/YbiS/YcfS/YnhG family)
VRRLTSIVLAVTTVLLGASPAAGGPVDEPATASARAVRDVQWSERAPCDLLTVRSLARRSPSVRQFVVASTPDWSSTTGTVFVAVRRLDGTWRCQTSPAVARFGRNGTRPLLDRRSGDGTTPAGVFPLGRVTAWDGETFSTFGNSPDPGVRPSVGYRDVRPEDCWGATPNTPSYQHLVDRPGCPGPDDEWLPRFGDVYAHAAVIGANLSPISGDAPGEPPYAAAIFLHRHAYTSSGATRPTSGCVSLGYGDLVAVLRALDPALSPHFAIGPTDWLRS